MLARDIGQQARRNVSRNNAVRAVLAYQARAKNYVRDIRCFDKLLGMTSRVYLLYNVVMVRSEKGKRSHERTLLAPETTVNCGR